MAELAVNSDKQFNYQSNRLNRQIAGLKLQRGPNGPLYKSITGYAKIKLKISLPRRTTTAPAVNNPANTAAEVAAAPVFGAS